MVRCRVVAFTFPSFDRPDRIFIILGTLNTHCLFKHWAPDPLGPIGTGESQPRIAQRAMHCLLSYKWLGNVRELQNVLERGMILSEQNLITKKELSLNLAVTLDRGSSDQPFQTWQEI